MLKSSLFVVVLSALLGGVVGYSINPSFLPHGILAGTAGGCAVTVVSLRYNGYK